MKKTLSKLTLGLMIGLVLLWIIVFAYALTDVDGVLDMWAYLVLISVTLPALAVLLILLNFVRRLLAGTIRYADRPLFVFSLAATAVFSVFTLIVVTVNLAYAVGMFDVEAPYNSLYFHSALSRMLYAFGFLAIISFAIGALTQFAIKKLSGEARPGLPKGLRVTAMALTVGITLAVLFMPNPSGTYNDGGSRIYYGVFYEAIDWNRTQEFDGTPFHEENQQMRIYWFPQNCYDYHDKWDLKH